MTALQEGLFVSLSDKVLDSLETDGEGKIKYSAFNVRTAGRSLVSWAIYRRKTGGLVDWMVKQLGNLFNLNTKYINTVATATDALEARTRKILFLNLGYDIEKGEIIKDGWLDNLAAQEQVKQRVINRINAAVQSRTSLADFRKSFRDDFLDTKDGLGYPKRYFNQKTFDLFQMFDRSAQATYGERLKLEYATYNGTIMHPVPATKKTKGTKGSRPFCWARVGNLYTLEEIRSWNEREWSGKMKGVDVVVAAGGHQCRHSISMLSAELAETLQSRGKNLNAYTPLPPHLKGKK